MKKFSKNALVADLYQKVDLLEEEFNFDLNNGWDQVKNSPFERILAFGQYTAYLSLIDDVIYNAIGQ